MLGLSWVMILMVTMMKRDAASADIIKVSKVSGEGAVLPSGFQGQMLRTREDFRWTHSNLLLTNKSTRCHHGRCQLLQDGSLSFSAVQAEDSGSYTLEVYDQHGTMKEKKEFLLQVTESPTVRIAIISWVIPLFLLLLFITVFILRKRRLGRSRTSGAADDQRRWTQQVLQLEHGVSNFSLFFRSHGGDQRLHRDAW
ncbi:uncharacterized protein V3H82_020390 isoform 1-T2 [Fundulus diaphanus]